MKDKRQKELEEKQKIKELVMSYDRMDDSNSDADGPSPLSLSHISLDPKS